MFTTQRSFEVMSSKFSKVYTTDSIDGALFAFYSEFPDEMVMSIIDITEMAPMLMSFGAGLRIFKFDRNGIFGKIADGLKNPGFNDEF